MSWPLSNEQERRRLARAFSNRNIPFDAPSFYDHPTFLAQEQKDPRFLELYARYVEARQYGDSYLADAAAKIDIAANALISRLTDQGGQSANYFKDMCAHMGYSVTVTNFDLFDVDSTAEDAVYSAPWQFAFQINAPLATVFEFAVTDSADEPLAAWSNAALECSINRHKPAHTLAIFSYS